MKRVLLIAATIAAGISTSPNSYAQTGNVYWAKHYGGTGGATAQSVTTDAAGNIYGAGYFYFGLTLDNVNLTSAGNADILVKKTDANGNVLWAKSLGGAANDFGFQIVADATGHIYVVGTFRGTATIGTQTMTSVDLDDALIVKMDAGNGNVIWAKGFGSNNDDGAVGVAVDGSGNVYVTGYYGGLFTGGSITFGSTTLTSKGSRDIFITKLNSSGDVQWAKGYGSAASDEGGAIALNSGGDIYFTGKITGATSFGSAALTTAGSSDVFVAKLENTGDVMWAKAYGGAGVDVGEKIVVDNSGKLYVSGGFFGTASFGTHSFTSAGNGDMFLMRLDAAGTIDWAKHYGGAGYEEAFDLAIDGNSNVFISGMMDGSCAFGSITLTSLGASDVFAAKVNSADGSLAWATNFGGAGNEYGRAITGDGNGNAIIYGEHNSEFVLGKDTIKHYKGKNFLTKISGAVTTGIATAKSIKAFELYPNPAGDHITIKSIAAADVRVYNAAMQLQSVTVKGNIVNTASLPSGIYYIQATENGVSGMVRFVKQ